MDTNPYAPPSSRVADNESDTYGLKRRGILAMVGLLIITFGLYYLVWFFRRRPGLNRLNSPRKLPSWPLSLLAALYVVQFVVAFVTDGRPVQLVIGPGPALFLQLSQIAIGISMIVQCFRIKDIIEDHATPDGPDTMSFERVKLSGLMTFFFSIFYLQWAINRYVLSPQEVRP